MLQTINYGYDNVDNLTSVTYPTGTPTTFTYDNDGRQLIMTDSTGSSSWLYDNSDNVTKLTTPQGVMDYAYDVWNRRTKLSEGTVDTNYAYAQGRLSTITKSNDGVATTIGYDQYGRVTTKNDGATTTTYGYDTSDRVNSILHAKTSDSSVLHQEWYSYDYANNLTGKVVNSVSTTYTYDAIDQLSTESGNGLSNTYSYDHNGNRTVRTSNTGTDLYSYDDADKLLSVQRTAGTTSYTYDDCGRPTQIGARTLMWDYDDRLTNLTGGGVLTTGYIYNGVGSRVSKVNSAGARTYKRNGVSVTAPVLSDGVANMVPGISETTGSTTNTILSDRMGSMKGLSASGIVTDTAEFDAFGKVVSRTGTNATQKGFASELGYQEDGESGYKLLGHRYYDADTGRFLSRDPVGDGRNWYAYCVNNPLKVADPTGLRTWQVKKGTDDYNQVEAGIHEIAKTDKAAADYLQKMLDGGQIYMDDDMASDVLARTPENEHRIYLNSKDATGMWIDPRTMTMRGKGSSVNIAYYARMRQYYLLAGVLYHEYFHSRYHSDGLPNKKGEREFMGWSAQANILKRLLKSVTDPSLRTVIMHLIGEAEAEAIKHRNEDN